MLGKLEGLPSSFQGEHLELGRNLTLQWFVFLGMKQPCSFKQYWR